MLQSLFLNGAALQALYRILREKHFSRLELNALIEKRLQTVLVSAYRHVPWYREMMEGVDYNPMTDYQGCGDLQKLPILRKTDIKERDITAFVKTGTDLSRAYSAATSGSTGVPLRIYQSAHDVALRMARPLYISRINGYSMRDKVMGIVPPGRLKQGQRHQYSGFGLFRKFTLDYSQNSIGELVDALLEYRPDALYGNRAHLDLMALELKRRGISSEHVGLTFLSGGAEEFHERNRRLYREQFGVELLDMYGSTELALMAYETIEHNGLHLFENHLYYECLDPEGHPVRPGTPGRLVVTDLTRTLMPFIRYDQGDLVVMQEEDDAGGKMQKITRIIGRQETDNVRLPDGSTTTAFQFIGVLKNYDGLIQFRIIQRTLRRFDILVVTEPSYLSSIQTELLQQLQQHFPPSVTFHLVRVAQLDPDPNGKLRVFISEIEQP